MPAIHARSFVGAMDQPQSNIVEKISTTGIIAVADAASVGPAAGSPS